MTSVFSGGNVSGIESQLSGLVPQFSQYASEAAGLEPRFLQQADTLNQQGGSIYPIAADQYAYGAAGQLTPAQQVAVDQTKQQMDLATSGGYSNLGLGGSTMKTQDLDANAQKSLAQTVGFSALDETLGMEGLKTALGYETAGTNALTGALSTQTGAGNILAGATGALGSAGQLAAGQEQLQMQTLGNLGSALGSKL